MCRCVFMYACVPVYRIRRSTCVGDQVRAQNVLLPVSLWQKYQRGRDHLEGSHGPTQGRHRQWLRLICSVIMSCTLVTPPNVEKTGFFSQLLVGRSSLSICSCVIKSLRDLTAICLRYINYQDEAVQKKKTLWSPSTIYLTDKHHSQLSHFTAFYDCLSEPWENAREHETSNQGRLRLAGSDSPKWLTPSCISKPSTVLEWGHIMMPALFMRIFTCFSSVKNIPHTQEKIKEC